MASITQGSVAAWELINTTKKYGTHSNGGGSEDTRGGGQQASVQLVINAGSDTYYCQTAKAFKDKFNIQQEVDAGTVASNNSQFIKLTSSAKDPAAASFHNAKAILIKNISNVTAEVYLRLQAWKNNGGASHTYDIIDASTELDTSGTSGNRYITFLLPANEFVYLPNSRWLQYTPYQHGTAGNVESGAYSDNGDIGVEPKDINSGNEYVNVTDFTDSSAELVNDGSVAATTTSITVDDGSQYKTGDTLRLGSEIVEVISVSGNDLTVQRGLDGSTAAAVSDDTNITWAFHNRLLRYDVGKCVTTTNGSFKQTGAFFSKGRTNDGLIDGLVPGSVAIGPFYSEGGYLDWGLSNVKASSETGLAASTAYAFDLVLDEYNADGKDTTATEATISFTTDSSDTTWNGSSNAVIPKIQAAIDDTFTFVDGNFGTGTDLQKNRGATIGIVNGDIRITSKSNHSETIVGISAPASGTTPFGVGRFPDESSSVPQVLGSLVSSGTDGIMYGPASRLALETIDDPKTGQTLTNTDAFLIDDGNGNLLHNGVAVGKIDYVTGHTEWTAPFLSAEFKVYGQTYSAHAGGLNFSSQGNNFIIEVGARSVNQKSKSQIQVVALT
tara:strand:- start:423 stop:2258 length:1836 start_codon:yes stop_codon:yes gene_type:complete